MTLEELFNDKSLKAKSKVLKINEWLLKGSLPVHELLAFAGKQKGSNKATCIEAIEFSTKQKASIADESVLEFVSKTLLDDEPRVKWESAKVIANIAHLFPAELKTGITNLLKNTDSEGTVVRWASATALGEILKLKTLHNKKLLPTIEKICTKEPENSIRKKYLDAIKKVTAK